MYVFMQVYLLAERMWLSVSLCGLTAACLSVPPSCPAVHDESHAGKGRR